MPAVLRVSGSHERLRQAFEKARFPFSEAIASRKGREGGESRDDTTTFNLTISEADGDRVPAQIEDASRFILSNLDAINELREAAGVDQVCIDFSWDFPRASVGQYNRFPSSFLRQCGILGIGIEISVYAVSDDR